MHRSTRCHPERSEGSRVHRVMLLGTCGGTLRLVLFLFCFSHIPHFGECGENTPEFPEFIQFNYRIE